METQGGREEWRELGKHYNEEEEGNIVANKGEGGRGIVSLRAFL